MAFMKWDNTYSIDIPVIDDQHKRLFELIEQFYEAIHQKQTKQAIAEILQGLSDYTVYHFDSEETLMKRHNYPAYLEHKSAHDMFVNEVNGFRERFENGRLIIPLEIANFLKEWLSSHIFGTDKQLKSFFGEELEAFTLP